MGNEYSQDTSSLLEALRLRAALPLGQALTLQPHLYTDEKLLALERQRIFKAQWLCAGRADSLCKAGDYLTYHIDSQPVVIIRQVDDTLKAFANVCRHRMMQLLEGQGECPNKRIVCPYHAWSYHIDGHLIGAPQMDTREQFDKKDYPMQDIRCEVWLGWIYVTLNPTLAPVAESLSTLETLVEHYQMQDYVHAVQKDHVWKTNWKLLTENFMESYHLPVAHKKTVGSNFPLKDTNFGEGPRDPNFTYQLFGKPGDAFVGNAHANNTRLVGEQRHTSIMPTVFPSHMFVLAPDHLWYLSLQPISCDEVSVRFGAALAPEVLEAAGDPEALIASISDFLDVVNEEDRFLVEGIMKGAKAPLSSSGPLSWLEQSNHEFSQYLDRRLNQYQ